MPNNIELIEKSESELWEIINRMHREGVRYKIVYGILEEIVKTLEIQGYAEQWLEHPPDAPQ